MAEARAVDLIYEIEISPDTGRSKAVEMALWIYPLCGKQMLAVKNELTDAALA